MGSFVELNDTLQITTEQGFPKELDLDAHRKKAFTAKDFKGNTFTFFNKPNARVYHTAPTRCFLVHNINGKWLYWGHVLILAQTITTDSDTGKSFTSGKYKIVKIYDPKYQEEVTRNETKPGESYF